MQRPGQAGHRCTALRSMDRPLESSVQSKAQVLAVPTPARCLVQCRGWPCSQATRCADADSDGLHGRRHDDARRGGADCCLFAFCLVEISRFFLPGTSSSGLASRRTLLLLSGSARQGATGRRHGDKVSMLIRPRHTAYSLGSDTLMHTSGTLPASAAGGAGDPTVRGCGAKTPLSGT